MFSYEEMIDISKKYRFKLDFNTKQFSVIDNSTKEKLSDSEETNRIKGLLYAKEIIAQYVMAVSKNKSQEQREQIGREEFEKLQKDLIQIGLKGEYTMRNMVKSGLQGYSPTEMFLSHCAVLYSPYRRR